MTAGNKEREASWLPSFYPDYMLDEQLAAKTKYYKEIEEGVAIVCKAIGSNLLPSSKEYK